MNAMWSKRGVLIAIVVTGAAGRLAGCATMGGSAGHMMYDLPLVIAGSNEGQLVMAPTSRTATAAIDVEDRLSSTG